MINRMQRKLKEIASFLPICATCKKVRPMDSDSNDPRSWINIENYFDQQTDEKLTHGICPDCLRRAMKEINGLELVIVAVFAPALGQVTANRLKPTRSIP